MCDFVSKSSFFRLGLLSFCLLFVRPPSDRPWSDPPSFRPRPPPPPWEGATTRACRGKADPPARWLSLPKNSLGPWYAIQPGYFRPPPCSLHGWWWLARRRPSSSSFLYPSPPPLRSWPVWCQWEEKGEKENIGGSVNRGWRQRRRSRSRRGRGRTAP